MGAGIFRGIRIQGENKTMIRLAIGTDTLVLPKDKGWVNYDIRKVHPDIIQFDVRNPLPYENKTVSEIYAGHFFDHLTYFEGLDFLKQCKRLLTDDGVIEFSIMDTNAIIAAFLTKRMSAYDNLQPIEYRNMESDALKFGCFLLGNLAHEKEYTGHKMVYTQISIKEVARMAGFKSCNIIEPDFQKEPWCVENPEYKNHAFYVEIRK
jgi:hypothetical protein